MATNKHVVYLIDGVDFKNYGVYVSASNGIIGKPKLKPFVTESWADYHGETPDLQHKYYQPREILLSCFIKANSKVEFIQKFSEFSQLFDKKGTQRLMIDVHPTKPLVYEVYCKDDIDVVKEWSDELMVGTFKLKLIEPEPLKRVVKHTQVIGRNLVANSQDVQYVGGSGDPNKEIYVFTNLYAELIEGETYTFSCKTNDPQTWGGGVGLDQAEVFLMKDKAITGGYVRIAENPTTFIAPQSGKFYIRIDSNKASVKRGYWEFQIEKGNKATEWNQAIEDGNTDFPKSEITITTDKLVNVYWGDGACEFDVFGNNIKLSHMFDEAKDYFIIISGDIDEIKSITTNATTVWNKL